MSAALIAVVGATVLVDRSHHSSRSSQITADSKVMSQVNGNVAPCSEAIRTTIAVYRDLTVHSLTPSELGRAPACSAKPRRLHPQGRQDLPALDYPGP